MRVIAGKLKSRTLNTLKGDTTRPSSDRMKEALFNQLGPYFDGGHFLDVFSGSGAVAIEAISRGMAHADLIEKDKQAQKVIQKNIQSFQLSNQMNLLKGDAQAVLKTLNGPYDIIFMDPPYDYEAMHTIIELASRLLKESGVLIVETDKFTTLDASISNVVKYKEKQYGFAKIHQYKMSK